jgi:xanthine dehydrogenase small subunit
MDISFRLNGEMVVLTDVAPTVTALDWLRETRGLTATKEGCNEGDCGACTVMVTDADGTTQALNACILFLPQLDGRALRTVEGVSGPDGAASRAAGDDGPSRQPVRLLHSWFRGVDGCGTCQWRD